MFPRPNHLIGLTIMASTLAMSRAFQFGTRLAAVSSSSRTRASQVMVRSPMYINSSSSSKTRTLSRRFMSTAASLTDEQKLELEDKIKQKGDEIRILKDDGISKDDLKPHVAELLELKAQLDPSSVAPKKEETTTTTTKEEEAKSTTKPKTNQR